MQRVARSRFITPSEHSAAADRDVVAAESPSSRTGLAGEAGSTDPVLQRAQAPESSPHQGTASRRDAVADELRYAREVLARSREAMIRLLSNVRLGGTIAGTEVMPVVADIASSVDRHPSALISCARLKSRDEYTYMHSVAVAALMLNLARRMRLSESERLAAGIAGLLHDVGKMVIPDAILNKPAKLSEEEFALMRTHSERGHAILAASGDIPDVALDVCLHHHEKMDGSGYPHGLRGGEISLHARMGAICDVYDAITSRRTYKDAWSPSESLARMYSWQGHFDGDVLQSFIKSLGIYPIGSLVRLSSARLAVVIEQNEEDALRPLVRCFYSLEQGRQVAAVDVDLAARPGADTIVSRENPAAWGYADWERFWGRLVL